MTLQNLIERGEVIGYENGHVVTAQELLRHQLGRKVEWDESVSYIKKHHFINKFKQYADNSHHGHLCGAV